MNNAGVRLVRRLKNAREIWRFLATQEAFHRAPLLTLFRLVTWYCRCWLHMPAVAKLPRWDVRMSFPTQSRGPRKFLFAFREYYESELPYLERILSPGKVFIDVGANFGIYTLVASKLVGDTGKVLAFEPTAESFGILRKNVELNHCSNVSAFQVALAETKDKAWLNHEWDPSCNWLRKDPRSSSDGEEVQTVALDQLLEECGVDRVDAMKIDAEGAEELILRGAIRCIATQSPIIIFEFNPPTASRLGLSPSGARDLLESLGYEFLVLNDCARDNRASTPTYFNIVAIPKPSSELFCGSLQQFPRQTEIARTEEP